MPILYFRLSPLADFGGSGLICALSIIPILYNPMHTPGRGKSSKSTQWSTPRPYPWATCTHADLSYAPPLYLPARARDLGPARPMLDVVAAVASWAKAAGADVAQGSAKHSTHANLFLPLRSVCL